MASRAFSNMSLYFCSRSRRPVSFWMRCCNSFSSDLILAVKSSYVCSSAIKKTPFQPGCGLYFCHLIYWPLSRKNKSSGWQKYLSVSFNLAKCIPVNHYVIIYINILLLRQISSFVKASQRQKSSLKLPIFVRGVFKST